MKIRVHKGLILLAIIAIALNFGEQFFIVFLLALAHEMGHVATAAVLGVGVKRIHFTPLGMTAVLVDFEKLRTLIKAVILIAGPFVNLALIPIFYIMNRPFLWQANLILFIFNMLPIYPLDGGRLLSTVLSKKIGMISANTFLMITGRFFIGLIFIFGFIQVILFPFNISLICLGVYLKKAATQHYKEISTALYTIILQGEKAQGILPIKLILVDEGYPTVKVINRLHHESFHIVYTMKDGEVINILDEKEIVKEFLGDTLDEKG